MSETIWSRLLKAFLGCFGVVSLTVVVIAAQLFVVQNMDDARRKGCTDRWAHSAYRSEYKNTVCYVISDGSRIPEENFKVND